MRVVGTSRLHGLTLELTREDPAEAQCLHRLREVRLQGRVLEGPERRWEAQNGLGRFRAAQGRPAFLENKSGPGGACSIAVFYQWGFYCTPTEPKSFTPEHQPS